MAIDEGYIKYKSTHISGIQPHYFWIRNQNRIRTELFDLGLIGVTPEGIGFGNISSRLSMSDSFIISGAATGNKRELKESDYSEVLSFDIEKNSVTCIGKIKSSSESMTHGAIYHLNKAIKCVIHVHHSSMWEYMISHHYDTTSPDAAFGTQELATEIRDIVKGKGLLKGIIALKGHKDGVIAYGQELNEVKDLILEVYNKVRK